MAVVKDKHIDDMTLTAYGKCELPVKEFFAVDNHVASCELCKQAYSGIFGSFEDGVELYFGDPIDDLFELHLEDEDIFPYVEGKIKDREHIEIIEAHIKECKSCCEAVRVTRLLLGMEEKKSYWSHVLSRLYSFWNQFNKKIEFLKGLSHTVPNQETVNTGNLYNKAGSSIFFFNKGTGYKIKRFVPLLMVLVFGVCLTLLLIINVRRDKTKESLQETSSTEILQTVANNTSQNTQLEAVSNLDSKARESKRKPSNQKRDERLLARLDKPEIIAKLDNAPPTLRDEESTEAESFTLLNPVYTLIRNTRPAFHWRGIKDADSYTVRVFDQDFNLVVSSEGPVTTNEWQSPTELQTGTTYSWKVTAYKDGKRYVAPVAPQRAEFRVADRKSLTEINSELGKTNSPISKAFVLAKSGLLDEAELMLSEHLKKYPHSTRAKQLLRKIKSWRP